MIFYRLLSTVYYYKYLCGHRRWSQNKESLSNLFNKIYFNDSKTVLVPNKVKK